MLSTKKKDDSEEEKNTLDVTEFFTKLEELSKKEKETKEKGV